jgi:hypothetical protein
VAGVPFFSGAGGVGLIPAISNAQHEPAFRRLRFEIEFSPFYYISIVTEIYIIYHAPYTTACNLTIKP